MRPEIKVYIASKVEHAGKLANLTRDGFHISARWIDTAHINIKKLKPVTHWQRENFDDIEAAQFFILYVEPGDKLKGALVELGYAVAWGKPVFIAGDGHGVEVPIGENESIRLPHRDLLPWANYAQAVTVVSSLDEAFARILARAIPQQKMNHEGATP